MDQSSYFSERYSPILCNISLSNHEESVKDTREHNIGHSKINNLITGNKINHSDGMGKLHTSKRMH